MRAPEAVRRLRGMHPQAEQATGTHVGPGDRRVMQDGLLGLGVGAGVTSKRGALTLDGMRTRVVGCGAG